MTEHPHAADRGTEGAAADHQPGGEKPRDATPPPKTRPKERPGDGGRPSLPPSEPIPHPSPER